jgi:uncharacterized protein
VRVQRTRHLILGAGVAGLFTAFEMNRLGESSFLLVDRGEPLSERQDALERSGLAREKAAQAVLYGEGGAGLFSDGKLNFSSRIGGDVYSVLNPGLHQELVDFAISTFDFEVTPPNLALQAELDAVLFSRWNSEFIPVPQTHIGSDHLPRFVRALTEEFASKILYRERFRSVKRHGKGFAVETTSERIECDRLIVAVGQAGYKIAETIARQFRVTVEPGPADLGIRVEMPYEVWEPIVAIQWDPKIYWSTEAGDVRTFCTNPRGYVVGEFKRGFYSVNGHAKRDTKSMMTNLALMLRVSHSNPNEFLIQLCRRISEATGNRLLVQRVEDFLAGEPTTSLDSFRPTCTDFVLGDIEPFYPRAASDAYRSVLSSMIGTFPELRNSGAIIYAPEVKLYSNRVKVLPDSFESEVPGLFFIGDSCGRIHGLTNAMLSGLACGRHCAGAVLPKGATESSSRIWAGDG